ncbi:hypothetical protein PLESTF_001102200 [Pleodorina starrii]|nr:hypothetical protein PLESTF_001102200 [Pleodorina starrii]
MAPWNLLQRRQRASTTAARASSQGIDGTPSIDYVGRLKGYKYGQGSCPMLFLAPMENLADRPFRRALAATIGGFDEACTEFLRIPGRSDNPLGSIRGVTSPARYDPRELQGLSGLGRLGGGGGGDDGGGGGGAGGGGGGGIPLGAQIMGSNPEYMGMAARYLVQVRGAPRVDLNCGCPANTVTGNGAGSSLLRTPRLLGDIVEAMVREVGGEAPVSVKLRAGFDDTSLLEDNLLAAQEAGASFVTLHPRTRGQAYSGAADWGLIARAVELLDIPVIGNGDVVSVSRAHALLRETGCHGLMVGRGAVHDPLIFHRIRHSFSSRGADDEAAAAAAAAAAGERGASGSGSWSGSGSGEWEWRWQSRWSGLSEADLIQDFLRAYAAHFVPGIDTGLQHTTRRHQQQQQQQQPQPQPQQEGAQRFRDSEPPTRGSLVTSTDPDLDPDSDSESRAGGRSDGDAEEVGVDASSWRQRQREGSGVSGGAGSGDDVGVCGGGGGGGVEVNAVKSFGRLKVVMRYLFASSPQLAEAAEGLLRRTPGDCSAGQLVGALCEQVERGWPAGGPSRRVLYDHMNKRVRELAAA